MQNVVIDTNVFVGACLGLGAANRVIGMCLEGAITPVMGAALLAEYEEVLGRERLFATCRLDAAERQALLDIFLATSRWTRIYFGWRPNLRDEADNHVVELAVASGASCIITRNLRDFAAMDLSFPGIRTLTPQAFLKEPVP